ncbi:MAG TPA: M13 family metallopeptidase [Steroidobacteraceae bacterium]|nr:M13 family metallopeptidase [Steroidobacteraceae bacterium]
MKLLLSTSFRLRSLFFGTVMGAAAGLYGASGAAAAKSSELHGPDLSTFDTKVRPQDDFYSYVNGGWMSKTEIPADRSRYGTFHILNDRTEAQLKDIVTGIANDPKVKAGSDAQKIRDMYASFMDEAKLEKLGASPVASQFAAIDGLKDSAQLSSMMATLFKQGVNVPVAMGVHQDNKDSTRYVVDLVQFGLDLPDRDYYLKDGDDGTYKNIRNAYEQHIVAMFKLAGLPQPEQSAKDILQFETSLAQAQWSKVANRDPIKTYNKVVISELSSLAPQFNWNAYLDTTGLAGKIDYILVSQPSYITEVGKLTQSVPLETWKTYLKWKALSSAAPYLSKAFVDEDFAFEGKTISGTPEIRARWKRGLNLLNGSMGELLGKLYVTQYFPAENKRHMVALVNNLIATYGKSIDTLDWMSDATKQQARVKLSKLQIKIGYPDKWRDYSGLNVTPDDLWNNIVRSNEFDYQYQLGKLGKPIDRAEWHMTPQTVNAYYNPEMNEIVFPAAILQPPFFDINADDALNYGAIGSVIGHEISHGFDDQGSQFDGNGNLRDWWTKEDHEKFKAKTSALIKQYAALEAVPGYHLNGELTLGENIADVSGTAIAFKAYQLSLKNKKAPVIEGFTGEQRFFIGLAVAWQNKVREKEAIRLVTIDPHSPPVFRVRGAVTNLDAFYKAFDIKPADKMFLAPEQRVSIW